MFSKLLDNTLHILKDRNNYASILIILGIGIFTLLIDAPKYKNRGYVKEVKIIKAISYSYMALGGIMFVLLLMT